MAVRKQVSGIARTRDPMVARRLADQAQTTATPPSPAPGDGRERPSATPPPRHGIIMLNLRNRRLQPICRTARQYLHTIATALPDLCCSRAKRRLFVKMRAFIRELPRKLQSPLPEAMRELLSAEELAQPIPHSAETIRRLVDLAILLNRQAEPGLCMRRSLTRFYFLRQAGVPVQVCFGARLVDEDHARRLSGHAWLMLDGKPYHEPGNCVHDYVVMYAFPD